MHCQPKPTGTLPAFATSHGDDQDSATIHQLIAEQAVQRPTATAVLDMAGERLTYAGLDRQATAVAEALMTRGVAPGDYVVVRMPRDLTFVVGLLGILKAGAAYIAAEPAWPAGRVRRIVATAHAHVLTADDDPRSVPRLRPAPGRQRLTLRPGRIPEPPRLPAVDGSMPCTVFFTSGSTGEPKGAVSPHRAVVRRFVGVSYADFGPGRTVLQAAPVCWDGMPIELWSVLMNGGTSLLLGEGQHVTPDLIRRLDHDAGLDTLWLTSSLFNGVVDDDVSAFAPLRQLLIGGEKLSCDHVTRFRSAHPGVRLVNGYGPAETTVFATTHIVQDGDATRYGQIPLGTPLPRTTIHILTEANERCLPGQIGEICIGGDGLALGYLGDDQLTAERFVTTSWGERVYRSGDLGQWHPDGVVLYHGRRDRQVKIRGQRVEPAELERFLEAKAGVGRAVVTVLRNPHGSATGLAAHWEEAAGPPADHVRERCDAELPPYLRPQRLLVHPAFPLTPSGKTDLRALRDLADAAPRSNPAPDDGGDDDVLRAFLREAAWLLGMAVGPDDDLFALGGDSLFAMRLVSRLARLQDVVVTVDAVHRERSARAIRARAARGRSRHDAAPGSDVVRDGRLDLWLREQLEPGDHAQLLTVAFEVRPALDPAALRIALDALTARHPALRTGFRLRNDTVHTLPLASARIPLRHTPPDVDIAAGVPAAWLSPFDLATEPPLRCYLTPTRAGSLLTLLIHHIAYDGWSEHILLRDLGSAYGAARTAGTGAKGGDRIPTDTVHRATASESARERARLHWRHTLREAAPLPLPAGDPTAQRLSELPLTVSAHDVTGLCRAADSDPHTSALAWYGHALHAVTGRDIVTVGSYYAGREAAEENSVGYFVRPVPVVLNLAADPTLAATATQARHHWLAGIGQAELPLLEIANQVPRPRDRTAPPVFQAAMAFQNTPRTDLRLVGHQVTRRDVPHPAAPLPLVAQIWPVPDGSWDVRLQCDPTRVADSLLKDLAEQLSRLLTRLPGVSVS